ncbi:hypothetical protein B566_EDAN007368 [Ephemera danica]|nr:hypothetical protein B566_EDAN007368 [Ephemera danica]
METAVTLYKAKNNKTSRRCIQQQYEIPVTQVGVVRGTPVAQCMKIRLHIIKYAHACLLVELTDTSAANSTKPMSNSREKNTIMIPCTPYKILQF